MRPLLEERASDHEAPKAQRLAARPGLEVLLPVGLTKARRDEAIAMAYRAHGYTLGEIAAHVGLHYSSVCRIAQTSAARMKDLTAAFPDRIEKTAA